jgi:hypothetical protein
LGYFGRTYDPNAGLGYDCGACIASAYSELEFEVWDQRTCDEVVVDWSFSWRSSRPSEKRFMFSVLFYLINGIGAVFYIRRHVQNRLYSGEVGLELCLLLMKASGFEEGKGLGET